MDGFRSDACHQLRYSVKQTTLRKEFIEKYSLEEFPQQTLLSLSQVYSDVESQGCSQPVLPQKVEKSEQSQDVCMERATESSFRKRQRASTNSRSNSGVLPKRTCSQTLQTDSQEKDEVSHEIPSKKRRLSDVKLASGGSDKDCSEASKGNKKHGFTVHRKSLLPEKLCQEVDAHGERPDDLKNLMQKSKVVSLQNSLDEKVFCEIRSWPKSLKDNFVEVLLFIKKLYAREFSTSEILHSLSKKFNMEFEYCTKVLPPVDDLPPTYECSISVDSMLISKAEGSTKKKARVAAAKLLIDKLMRLSQEIGKLSSNYFDKSLKCSMYKTLAAKKVIAGISNNSRNDAVKNGTTKNSTRFSSVLSSPSSNTSHACQNDLFQGFKTSAHDKIGQKTSESAAQGKLSAVIDQSIDDAHKMDFSNKGNMVDITSGVSRNCSSDHNSLIQQNESYQKNSSAGPKEKFNTGTSEINCSNVVHKLRTLKNGTELGNGFYTVLSDKSSSSVGDSDDDDISVLYDSHSCQRNSSGDYVRVQNSLGNVMQQKFSSGVVDEGRNCKSKPCTFRKIRFSNGFCVAFGFDENDNQLMNVNVNDSALCSGDSHKKNPYALDEGKQNSVYNITQENFTSEIVNVSSNEVSKLDNFKHSTSSRCIIPSGFGSSTRLSLNGGNVIIHENDEFLKNVDGPDKTGETTQHSVNIRQVNNSTDETVVMEPNNGVHKQDTSGSNMRLSNQIFSSGDKNPRVLSNCKSSVCHENPDHYGDIRQVVLECIQQKKLADEVEEIGCIDVHDERRQNLLGSIKHEKLNDVVEVEEIGCIDGYNERGQNLLGSIKREKLTCVVEEIPCIDGLDERRQNLLSTEPEELTAEVEEVDCIHGHEERRQNVLGSIKQEKVTTEIKEICCIDGHDKRRQNLLGNIKQMKLNAGADEIRCINVLHERRQNFLRTMKRAKFTAEGEEISCINGLDERKQNLSGSIKQEKHTAEAEDIICFNGHDGRRQNLLGDRGQEKLTVEVEELSCISGFNEIRQNILLGTTKQKELTSKVEEISCINGHDKIRQKLLGSTNQKNLTSETIEIGHELQTFSHSDRLCSDFDIASDDVQNTSPLLSHYHNSHMHQNDSSPKTTDDHFQKKQNSLHRITKKMFSAEVSNSGLHNVCKVDTCNDNNTGCDISLDTRRNTNLFSSLSNHDVEVGQSPLGSNSQEKSTSRIAGSSGGDTCKVENLRFSINSGYSPITSATVQDQSNCDSLVYEKRQKFLDHFMQRKFIHEIADSPKLGTSNNNSSRCDILSSTVKNTEPFLNLSKQNSTVCKTDSHRNKTAAPDKRRQSYFENFMQEKFINRIADQSTHEVHEENCISTGFYRDVASTLDKRNTSPLSYPNHSNTVLNKNASCSKTVAHKEKRRQNSTDSVAQEFIPRRADSGINNACEPGTFSNSGYDASLGIGRHDLLPNFSSNNGVFHKNNLFQEYTGILRNKRDDSSENITKKLKVHSKNGSEALLENIYSLPECLKGNFYLIFRYLISSITRRADLFTVLCTVSRRFDLNMKYDVKQLPNTQSLPVYECLLETDSVLIGKAKGSSRTEARSEVAKLAIYNLMKLASEAGILSPDYFNQLFTTCDISMSGGRFSTIIINRCLDVCKPNRPFCGSDVFGVRKESDGLVYNPQFFNSVAEHSVSCYIRTVSQPNNVCKSSCQPVYPAFVAILDYWGIAKSDSSKSLFRISADLNYVRFQLDLETVSWNTEPHKVRANIIIDKKVFVSVTSISDDMAVEAASKAALDKLRKTAFTIKVKFEHFDGFTVYPSQVRDSDDPYRFAMDNVVQSKVAETAFYKQVAAKNTRVPEQKVLRLRIKKIIDDYAKLNPINDLLFYEFGRKERTVICDIASQYCFKSYIIGGKFDGPKNIIVSRYSTAHALLNSLIQDGGQRLKYELIPPTG